MLNRALYGCPNLAEFNCSSQVIEDFLQEPELASTTLALLVGGRPIEVDALALQKGADIAVCTPGRLEDLLSERKQLNLAGRLKELVCTINISF